MGDPSKLILLEAVLKVMTQENLLERVSRVGDYTLGKLLDMEKEFSHAISSSRGRGTFIAFDCATPEMRDATIKKLLLKGTLPLFFFYFSLYTPFSLSIFTIAILKKKWKRNVGKMKIEIGSNSYVLCKFYFDTLADKIVIY